MRHNKTFFTKNNFTWKKRVGEQNGKPELLRYAGMIFLFCFIAGIIIANIIGKDQLGSFGIWNTYFIEKFKISDIRSDSLFFYIMEQRIPIILLLLVLVVTTWGIAAGIIFVGWQGFAAGFMMAASIINFGGKGILLVLVAVFPQYLIYIPIYIVYLHLAGFFKEQILAFQEPGAKGKGRVYLILAGLCLLILVGYITGIFLESYINPHLLKELFKFF